MEMKRTSYSEVKASIFGVHVKRDEDGNIILLDIDLDLDLKRIYQPGRVNEPPQGKGFKHQRYRNEEAENLIKDLGVIRSDDLLYKEVSVEMNEYGKVVRISRLNSR